jgi:hypothetical protein
MVMFPREFAHVPRDLGKQGHGQGLDWVGMAGFFMDLMYPTALEMDSIVI